MNSGRASLPRRFFASTAHKRSTNHTLETDQWQWPHRLLLSSLLDEEALSRREDLTDTHRRPHQCRLRHSLMRKSHLRMHNLFDPVQWLRSRLKCKPLPQGSSTNNIRSTHPLIIHTRLLGFHLPDRHQERNTFSIINSVRSRTVRRC
jgi:hypothetical protein